MHALLVKRADELMGCTENSPEEAELAALTNVIEAYESQRWPGGEDPRLLPKLPDSRSVATISAADVRVIDGDTISFKSIRYRFVGFDTPETLHAKCDSERTLGLQASARLRGLISSGEITLHEVVAHARPER